MDKVTLQTLAKRASSERVTLHFGQASLETTVGHADRRALQLPADVMRAWCLTPGQTLTVWRTSDGRHLHLGPLLGVVFEEPEPEVAEIRAATVHALGLAAEQAHVPLLCFSMHAVDMASGTVTGQLHIGGGHFHEATLPIPDVIYNRATYPNLSLRLQASAMRQRLRKECGVPFINPMAAFSKWDVHDVLKHFPLTRRHTPATIPLDSAASLQQFLKRHHAVFVKHDLGTWGQSVLKVTAGAGGEGPFHVSGYARDLPLSETFTTVNGLYDHLSAMPGGSGWIVQQAIDLLKVDERPFDLRLVLQKDGRGRWRVAQRLINWAGRGDVVTNNRRTAEFVPADEFQHRWPDGPSAFAELINKAVRVGRRTVQAMEAHYGMFGEIGLDIGFDQHGHAWVFEANAKPFLAPGVGTVYPFAYARYLATRFWRARHRVM